MSTEGINQAEQNKEGHSEKDNVLSELEKSTKGFGDLSIDGDSGLGGNAKLSGLGDLFGEKAALKSKLGNINGLLNQAIGDENGDQKELNKTISAENVGGKVHIDEIGQANRRFKRDLDETVIDATEVDITLKKAGDEESASLRTERGATEERLEGIQTKISLKSKKKIN